MWDWHGKYYLVHTDLRLLGTDSILRLFACLFVCLFVSDHPAAGVTGGCELPDVSAENRIWIF